MQTTLRYVNRDKTAIHQVANALDAFNSQAPALLEISQAVN
jgi:hypothetical protein